MARLLRFRSSVYLGLTCFILSGSLALAQSIRDETSEKMVRDLTTSELQDIDNLLEGQTSDYAFVDETSPGNPGEESEEDIGDARLVPLFVPGMEEETAEETSDTELLNQPAVLLRGLDKITGRTSELEVAVGEQVVYGGVRVTVRACHQTPPTEPPESIAYLEVEDYGFKITDGEIKSNDVDLNKRVFSGWMYASSPGINALEHPIYDVWVIRCMAEAPVRSDAGSGS